MTSETEMISKMAKRSCCDASLSRRAETFRATSAARSEIALMLRRRCGACSLQRLELRERVGEGAEGVHEIELHGPMSAKRDHVGLGDHVAAAFVVSFLSMTRAAGAGPVARQSASLSWRLRA